ncbi:hypothetical protein Tco_1125651 [Tanacetum coccineum]|uniref:Uncharacterized protein n=1 Tax=Tanacetum coccineum TaxID=301880 RepID=A0ABQ5J9L6_9ASTR
MNYYRPPPVQLAMLDLQRVPAVPAEWSPVPVVTASMSKSAQAAPIGYGQMSVMLQSLPASCGLPVASLKSQSDSYANLYGASPCLPGKPSAHDLVSRAVSSVNNGTDFHQPMSQLSDISGSVCHEYPLSQHRYPACPAPELQQA